MAVIYWLNRPQFARIYWPFSPEVERHPTMNRRMSSVASRLLARRAAALKRHLPGAVGGDAHGVHQARVASRRLREAVPVLTSDVKGTKSGKALGKIRRLTGALGTVRELDVTIQILDRLVAKESLPRPALEAVRGRVVTERDERRAVMLKRLERVNLEKLDRRLASMDGVARRSGLRGVARRAWGAHAQAVQGARRGHRRGRPHVLARAVASGAHRSQEAALCDGTGVRRRREDRVGARSSRQARAGHARPAARPAGAAVACRCRAGASRPAVRCPTAASTSSAARSKTSAAICTPGTWQRCPG